MPNRAYRLVLPRILAKEFVDFIGIEADDDFGGDLINHLQRSLPEIVGLFGSNR